MNRSATTCPYCNSLTPVPAGAVGGERLVCPRCGEPFTYRRSDAEAAAGSGNPLAPGTAPVTMPPPPQRRWTNWAIALTVLGGMALIAGGTVAFALLTVDWRRSHDKFPTESEPATVTMVAPRELAGLAYLPNGTDTVAALHVAEALQDPAGREFLTRFRAGDFLPLLQKVAEHISTEKLPQLTGLTLQEIDHVVIGTTVDTPDLVPPLTIVVQTRQPYDQNKIKEALQAHHSPKPGRELYEIQIARGVPALLWFAEKKTLVIGLKDVPAEAHTGRAHLAPAVREVLANHLTGSAQAWAIAHSDDWSKTSAGMLLLPRLAAETKTAVEKVRTVGVWLTFGDGLTLGGVADCADADSLAKLKSFLFPPLESGRKPIHVFGQRPEWEAVAKELGESVKVVESGTWLTVQARAKAVTVRQALAAKPPP